MELSADVTCDAGKCPCDSARQLGGNQPDPVLILGHGSKPMIPFRDRCTTHFRTYFSRDWDVHWGYDLGFDPWPFVVAPFSV